MTIFGGLSITPTALQRMIVMLVLFVGFSSLGGCADFKKTDPWEGYNRFMYKVDDNIDKYALKPASDFYVKVTPKQIQTILYNGYTNLTYGDVILNDFLQGKIKQGSMDFGRFAVNSTLGIAGAFDIASTINLPSHQNDFGLTLAQWGVPPGPYIVLPLLGPYTVRDVPDLATSYLTNPLSWVDMDAAAAIPVAVVQIVVMRASYEREVAFRDEAAIDPYVFTRDAYIQYRENLAHPGKSVSPKENIFDEDNEATTAPATMPATTNPTPGRNLPKIR